MKCDNGRLQAYLDGALSPQERAEIAEHLNHCTPCQETLAQLRQQGNGVGVHLRALDPQPGPAAEPVTALARFWKRVRPVERRAPQSAWAARWRPALVGLSLVAVLALLFSFAPVRQAAAEFLGLFRVRKFAVIPVDPARLQQLAELQGMAEGVLKNAVVLRDAAEPQQVADAAAASAIAGFAVRSPTSLPNESSLRTFAVTAGPAAQAVLDRAELANLLQAAGVEDIALPAGDSITVTVDMDTLVVQEYSLGDGRVTIVQTPSPAVTFTPEMDLTALGQAMLEFLGVAPQEARRLAQEIDWTSTLIIPLPTNVAMFREVEVDGVTGLVLEGIDPETSTPNAIVLWERDSIVYAVSGNLPADTLLPVASSLR